MRPGKLRGVAVVVALPATACGGSAEDSGAGTDKGARGSGFPVRIADCKGATTTFASAPRMIITSNAAALEMLLRLGAGDRVNRDRIPARQGQPARCSGSAGPEGAGAA